MSGAPGVGAVCRAPGPRASPAAGRPSASGRDEPSDTPSWAGVLAVRVYSGGNLAAPSRRGRPTWWWVVLGVGLALLAVLVALLVLVYTGAFGLGPSGPRPLWGYWGGFFLIFLLVWVSFFVLRIALWTGRRRGYYGGAANLPRDRAVMIARRRYARGEITREQFDQIMTDLQRQGRGPGGPLSGA